MPDGSEDMLVRADGITKHFGGVVALNRVSFDLVRGEVHALVGENGAGKSTFIKIVSGVFEPDSGALFVQGRKVDRFTPRRAIDRGISTVYQGFSLIDHLSVMENLFLGHEITTALPWWLNRREMGRRAAAILEMVGLRVRPETPVGELSVSEQQLVEIAKALLRDPKILILDEPTDKLTHRETQHLFTLLRELKQRGTGIIYITHKLEELNEIADRVSVLRDGERIAVFHVDENFSPRDAIRAMVGRDLSGIYPERKRSVGRVVLEVRGLSADPVLRDINLELRAGEVVGLAGLVGSGRSALAHALLGLLRHNSGTIRLEGRAMDIRSPEAAIRRGLVLIPEDRQRDGLFAQMAVRENMALPAVRRAWVDLAKMQQEALRWVKALRIRTPSTSTQVTYLSGGNQQKVVMARGLLMRAQVFILDEPTQGIDMGTRTEIYRLIESLAQDGVAILMISSELRELMGMCDRILAMHKGRIVREFKREDFSQEAILAAMFGEAA